VVGGVHATLMPEHVATFADTVVVGEAYHTWPAMLEDFANQNLKPLYRDESWAVLDNVAPLSQRVIDMMHEHENYWTPYLEITRGCPRDCSFCTAIRVSGRKMRLRAVDEVVEEIQRRRLKRFFLTDDNFGLIFRINPTYTEELFRAMAKLPLHGWTCQAELMVAQYPEMLELARRAHLDKFFIGFESLNPNNRSNLGGKSRGAAEQVRETVRRVHAHGIGVVGLFVLGFDDDTQETFEATWDFIRTSELDSVSITVLTPFPATPFREQLIQEGRLLDVPWRNYDTAHVVFQPGRMTVEELSKAYDWLCRKVYSPQQITTRGFRMLGRHPVNRAVKKVFGSFSTDFGYRRSYNRRHST
ncbi:MAG TPA: radical SAM protein, partial [Ardenticatenaceae bacterium]|nr:radical SAM protein [Ardenticatenaceae bacterium]